MCWSMTASVGMAAAGTAATAITIYRKEPAAISIALGYFTIMEALQAAGYLVINDCGGKSNQAITLLSFLHIVFQPFLVNAFAMELVPYPVRLHVRRTAFALCGLSAGVMLLQLMPIQALGACRPGDVLCGLRLCLTSGEWHIAWNIPYNGLMVPIDKLLGTHIAFPTYLLTVFVLPVVYGAWRFSLTHLLLGPIFAGYLTDRPNEWPAVWCLFSIGILVISLSPWIRRRFTTSHWWLWPKAWTPAVG